MATFPIHRVDRRRAQQVEPLGSKPKFWFRDDERRLLFKAEDRGTGEDWAEVIACHLCQLLGLPHVQYELAVECDGERIIRPGVLCENMAESPKTLILGNQLLLALDSDYPSSQRFKVKQHTIDAVCEILAALQAPGGEWMSSAPAGISTALDVFVGYVMLDAWIANQDRHHENWGAIWGGTSEPLLNLAPTFDHGAALARNLLDSEREERLTTRDRNRSIDAFVLKGRSAFYRSSGDSKPLQLLDAFQEFAARNRTASKLWIDQLQAVTGEAVWTILEQVPTERLTGVAANFTSRLLEINRQRLLETGITE